MLKIWGRTTSINVQKVLWCCAELDLKYERVDAGGKFGVTNAISAPREFFRLRKP